MLMSSHLHVARASSRTLARILTAILFFLLSQVSHKERKGGKKMEEISKRKGRKVCFSLL